MLNLIASWHLQRQIAHELGRLSDRELADVGIARSDIQDVSARACREAGPRRSHAIAPVVAPAWGAHARRSVTA